MTSFPRRSLTLPGCKSFTNRALLCAAAAQGRSHIHGASPSDDSLRMRSLLKACGVQFSGEPEDLEVMGLGGGPILGNRALDVGDTGTALRFLLPFVASGRGKSSWSGTARMLQRPLAPLLRALETQGSRFRFRGAAGALPFDLEASGIAGGIVEIRAELSSQFFSGLMLSAPLAKNSLALHLGPGPIKSSPYLEMTQTVQAAFGVSSRWGGRSWKGEGSYRADEYSVPADASAAFWFLGAVALAGGELRVENLGNDPVSRLLAGLELGEELGFATQREGKALLVRQIPGRPFRRDFSQIPDLVPVAAVLALFLEGDSAITGVPHLRWKESDRIAALAGELACCGAVVQEQEDGLRIEGGRRLKPARLSSHGDHRLAAAFSLLALRVPGIEIDDVSCISKSYPSFFQDFHRLFLDNPAR